MIGQKSTKKIKSFSIEESIADDFDDFCEQEAKNRSAVISGMMKNFVKKRKK